jgi:hypothetical protein
MHKFPGPEGFMCFFQSLHIYTWVVPWNMRQQLHLKSFPVYHTQLPSHLIQRYITPTVFTLSWNNHSVSPFSYSVTLSNKSQLFQSYVLYFSSTGMNGLHLNLAWFFHIFVSEIHNVNILSYKVIYILILPIHMIILTLSFADPPFKRDSRRVLLHILYILQYILILTL